MSNPPITHIKLNDHRRIQSNEQKEIIRCLLAHAAKDMVRHKALGHNIEPYVREIRYLQKKLYK